LSFFKQLADDRRESKGNHGNWDSTYKHLVNYCNPSTTFKDIDAEFIEGFKDYLVKNVKSKSGQSLSANSASSYFSKLKVAMKAAFKDKIINDDPATRVTGITPLETKREYLTMEEVKRLMKTECRYEVLKRAF